MTMAATKKKSNSSMLRIRQVRSGIGFPPAMRETLRALGLRRMHQVSERPDTPETRGMIAKIAHLVEIEQ